MKKDPGYKPKGYDFIEKLSWVFFGVFLGSLVGKSPVTLVLTSFLVVAIYVGYVIYWHQTGQSYSSYLKAKSNDNLQELAMAAKQTSNKKVKANKRSSK